MSDSTDAIIRGEITHLQGEVARLVRLATREERRSGFVSLKTLGAISTTHKELAEKRATLKIYTSSNYGKT